MNTVIESMFKFFKIEIKPAHALYAASYVNSPESGKISFSSAAGITILLIIFLFSGCSAPVKKTTQKSTPSVSRTHQNAPYNRPYKVRGKTYYPMPSAVGYSERGIASWYGAESGNRTAMGTRFNPQGMTAAHKTLPLPTRVRVTNLRNGRKVDVIVNDRGPFKKGRLIDLSQGAARKIGLYGLTEVKVEFLESLARNP